MKKIILFIIVSSIIFSSVSNARQQIFNTETMQNFAKVIRIVGYSCDSCVKAYFIGKKHRGKEFLIICDYERNMFRVILTNAGFIVKPI